MNQLTSLFVGAYTNPEQELQRAVEGGSAENPDL